MKRVIWLLALAGAAMLSCNVNDYCLNCATGDGDGGPGDGDDGDGGDGDAGDAGDSGMCVNTGPEVCDDKDNDCDGATDEAPLPTIGDLCSDAPALNTGLGECAGGVKQCVNGAVVCSKPAMPEQCDNLDNNCNGSADEGDPGGGADCGTDLGECIAGTNRCMNGTVQCIGAVGMPGGMPETCNGRDDDCDALFDEGLTNLGPCGTTDVGACSFGTLMCMGGGTVCVGDQGPVFELCDAVDQDCDGFPTNGYDLATDPQNCGMCGQICNLLNAIEGCAGGMCTIASCQPGFHNNDGMASTGCEFGPCTIQGNEVCNGIDDDCDGVVDDNLLFPPVGTFCLTAGECATGTTVVCAGAGGFRCNYADPDVSDDGMGNVLPETLCDAKDNDCDADTDEGQPNKGQACDNGMIGDCRSTGTFQCNGAMPNGPAVCMITQTGPGNTAEVCDGRDNNCNGVIDDNASAGNLPGQDWITIPGLSPVVQMMKYEASRPDATGTTSGALQTHACSRTGAQPWTNITYPQAVAACTSVGARLCSEGEWQAMCVPSATYPVTGPATTAPTDFAFIEAEDPFANTTIGGATRAWTRTSPTNFNGTTAMQVPDNGFLVSPATNALAQSSRLDYRLTLLGATNYNVWLRMRSPAPVSPLGTHTAATATLAPVSDAATAMNDLVIVTTWTVATTNNPTHTLQANFTEILSQPLDDGTNDGRLSVAYRVAPAGGALTYQAYTSSVGTGNFSGIVVLRAGTYDTNAILAATTSSTGNGTPSPPSVGPVSAPSTVLAIGAWHFTSSQTTNVSAPNTFSELWEMSGSVAGELSVAGGVTVVPGQSFDPANFGDNQSPSGTVAATIAIGHNRSHSVWVGLAAGAAAGAASATAVATALDNQWHWVPTPVLASGAAGTHTFSIYTREDGVMIDTIAVSRQSSTSPTFDNSWAYETNPRTAQPLTCNGDDFDADLPPATAGDQDDILATGSLAACHANKGADDAFDMSGNVKEWTSSRAAGQNPLRGGASNNEVNGLTCKLDFTLADDTFFFPNVGFRCCR